MDKVDESIKTCLLGQWDEGGGEVVISTNELGLIKFDLKEVCHLWMPETNYHCIKFYIGVSKKKEKNVAFL